MIKSMTGYGKAETLFGRKKITVEIRSLNSKQADLSVKLPPVYRQAEYALRSLVSSRLGRGKIDLFVCYEILGGATPVAVNGEVFRAYYEQLQGAAEGMEWGSKTLDAAALSAILRLPEVVRSETPETGEDEIAALLEAAESALNHIEAFREQEGAVLMADLLLRIGTIEQLKNAVAPYEAARVETVKTRIRENIEAVGTQVDPNRLEQEMIFYIEKLDITEEKVRLQNHLDYFREVAAGEETPGRKLGFIAQEIGREINTLGSKANEANIQRLVVQMKDELEKIKEQLLNIL